MITRCGYCGGHGEVQDLEVRQFGRFQMQWAKCDACNGTGSVELDPEPTPIAASSGSRQSSTPSEDRPDIRIDPIVVSPAFDRANHCRQIGGLGGARTVERHGVQHMRAIAKLGFETTCQRHFGGRTGEARAALLLRGRLRKSAA